MDKRQVMSRRERQIEIHNKGFNMSTVAYAKSRIGSYSK